MEAWQGEFVVEKVRQHYAGGNKSGNKIYCPSSAEAVPIAPGKVRRGQQLNIADYFDSIQLSLSTRIFASKKRLAKMNERNENAAASVTARGKVSLQIGGLSPYEAGKKIWQSKDHSLCSGNCGEMAYVASYVAVAAFNADAGEVWIGTISGHGDHMFCLVGSKPFGTTVKAMANLSIVIDPWLNVSCTAQQYSDAAANKLQKWQREGKRVCFKGSLGLGWYCPGGEYTDRFMTEPLSFSQAKP